MRSARYVHICLLIIIVITITITFHCISMQTVFSCASCTLSVSTVHRRHQKFELRPANWANGFRGAYPVITASTGWRWSLGQFVLAEGIQVAILHEEEELTIIPVPCANLEDVANQRSVGSVGEISNKGSIWIEEDRPPVGFHKWCCTKLVRVSSWESRRGEGPTYETYRFQAASFQLLKLENLLRWSLFTFIYNRSSKMS